MNNGRKEIAKTLKTVLDHHIMGDIIDRSNPIMSEDIDEVLNYWKYDLFKRNPAPAYINDNGDIICSDLDLATFLYTLADRGAVISIPSYKSMRATTVKEGQLLTSKENRHGKLIGLNANKETFSFGIKIFDNNVITTDSVGDFRNFNLTNLKGSFYSGWNTIQFLPTAKENNFINESGIASDNKIYFKNFVHPLRWVSFFGHKYFVTKALIDRLTEESSFYYSCIKEMLAEGINYPESGQEGAKKEYPKTEKFEGKKIKINCFEIELDIPWKEEFIKPEYNQQTLINLTEKRKKFIYTIIPQLRFATRATELAYFNMKNSLDYEPFPSWILNAKWEKNYIVVNPKTGRKGRKKWDRLILFQPSVGEQGVAIRRRVYEKTEEVSKDYED